MPRITLRTFVLSSVLTAAAIAAVVAVWYLASRDRQPTSPVVAVVNGGAVTAREVDIRVAQLLPMASFHGNIPPDRVRGLRRTALDELVLEHLIVEEARAAGIVIEEPAIEQELRAVRARFQTEEEFQAALKDNGETDRSFRTHLIRIQTIRRAQQQHLPSDPSEADLRAEYDANPGQFLRPEQIRLQELLVKVDPAAGLEGDGQARAKAESLLRLVVAGRDLGALAAQHSDDTWRAKRGELGWVHRGRLDPALERAAFDAPAGKAGLARSLAGYHVFRVLGRQPPQQLTYDEARATLLERVREQRRVAAMSAWHEGLRGRASVDILDAALKTAAPVVVRRFETDPRAGLARPMSAH